MFYFTCDRSLSVERRLTDALVPVEVMHEADGTLAAEAADQVDAAELAVHGVSNHTRPCPHIACRSHQARSRADTSSDSCPARSHSGLVAGTHLPTPRTRLE